MRSHPTVEAVHRETTISVAEGEVFDERHELQGSVALYCVPGAVDDLVAHRREAALELRYVLVRHELRVPAADQHGGNGDRADVLPERDEIRPVAAARLARTEQVVAPGPQAVASAIGVVPHASAN